jgi:hypothetical protein
LTRICPIRVMISGRISFAWRSCSRRQTSSPAARQVFAVATMERPTSRARSMPAIEEMQVSRSWGSSKD